MKLKIKRGNNYGFTLLEIIIVVIIIGGLASLALPRLFRTVYCRIRKKYRGLCRNWFLSRGTGEMLITKCDR